MAGSSLPAPKDDMNPSFQEAMRHATRLTQAGRLHEATALIQSALAAREGVAASPRPARDVVEVASPTMASRPPGGLLLDADRVCAGEPPIPRDAHAAPSGGAAWQVRFPDARGRTVPPYPDGNGFVAGTHTHASLTRHYKLFVPPSSRDGPCPLVVMLHGCTQDPDDFAAGTGMNRLALEHGVCVLYPAQAPDANPSRCWNWFKHNHQGRGRGEPAVIASMAQSVIRAHGIDPDRVYVAGLSAGGAMAALVGAAYPDVFAAVGVHSGLAPGVARSLPEALMAMNGAPAGAKPGAGAPLRLGGRPPAQPLPLPLPVIVFHGDDDRTVHPRNAEQVIAAALGATHGQTQRTDALRTGGSTTVQGVTAAGRRYTRHVHGGDAGLPLVEHWVLHGAGHAWSGGREAGSFTDPRGPDASREMLRFFLQNPRRRVQ